MVYSIEILVIIDNGQKCSNQNRPIILNKNLVESISLKWLKMIVQND